MKKKKSKVGIVITSIVLTLLVIAGSFAGGIWVYGQYFEKKEDPEKEYYLDLAEKYSEVSYDETRDVPFINNEIIVIAYEDTKREEIEKLADKYDGYISEEMSDIGVYKIKLDDSQKYKKLENIADEINSDSRVESAFISSVTRLEGDTVENELPVAKPLYPEDPWYNESSEKATWDDTPEGANWSLEAINAPEAWGYLDQLSTVKVGLIDTMVDLSHTDLKIHSAYAALTDTKTGTTQSGVVTNAEFTADDHGTHVAGTMCAVWDKDGVSGILGDKGQLCYGIAYNVNNGTIINEYTTPFNYFRAIKLLVDHGVRAINISQNTGRLYGFAASHGNKDAQRYLTDQAEQMEKLLERYIAQRQENGDDDFVICISAGNSNSTLYCESETSVYGYEVYDPTVYPTQIYKTPISGGSDTKYNNYIALIDSEEVMKRIIVVGSVGMTGKDTYRYSSFSCIGERVDIVAPGENVLSTVTNDKTSAKNGTSMAAPHVTAAAGLAFAANPSLTGPEVKRIVCSSVNGRYYHGEHYSGMLDLSLVVRNALLTKNNSVSSVVKSESSSLDVCFIVDTTGSMSDDIDNAKENMTDIVNSLQAKSPDFRVALIDYRDFSERTYAYDDYPAAIQFGFTGDRDAIISGINALTLGDGGDLPETVYSALAMSLELNWRDDAKKVIIILGDAEPLDPEPETGYTYDTIVHMLYEADLYVDTEMSDDRVLGDAEDSLISVFSISTSGTSAADEFFEEIALDTGGQFTLTENADEVSQAIVETIEDINIDLSTANLDFGEQNSGETVKFYLTDDNSFEFTLDEAGKFTLKNIEKGTYEWEIEKLGKSGNIRVNKSEKTIEVKEESKWYSFALILWQRHRVETIACAAGALILIIIIIVISVKLKRFIKRKKQEKAEKKLASPPAPEQNAVTNIKNNSFVVKNEPAASDKFCGYCGSRMLHGEVFCSQCGKRPE